MCVWWHKALRLGQIVAGNDNRLNDARKEEMEIVQQLKFVLEFYLEIFLLFRIIEKKAEYIELFSLRKIMLFFFCKLNIYFI